MCGIVGYIGKRPATDFLVAGLRRLEYRGYDSSGVATLPVEGGIALTKTAGRIDDLAARLEEHPALGEIGIGHTRWATHGPATDANAHPHVGSEGDLAVVHNGVIENFRAIKERLEEAGYVFRSETDSEAIAHLIAQQLAKRGSKVELGEDPYQPLIDAVSAALAQLQGTYGLAVVFRDWPDVIVAARRGSPLVVGVGDGEHFVASDGSPLVGHTERIVYLADHEIAVVTADTLRVIHRDAGHVKHDVRVLDVDTSEIELGGYDHYMLKEIFEQPETIKNAMRGRLNRDEATAVLGGLNLSAQELRALDRFVMTACGTSWHAALVGEYMIEGLARVPVEVEYASELRYSNPPLRRPIRYAVCH